ncbi:MAG: redoxin domain-containing protein [Bacteroidales bacterium]|nr:redoxin domain-containing protein [Bacteroidales bacterium]
MAQAIEKHHIDFEIVGLKDADVQIAIYHGTTAMEVAVLHANSQGQFTLSGDTLLVQGLYLVVLPNKQTLEFVVENITQFFSIKTSIEDLYGRAEAVNSNGNGMFFEYKRKNATMMYNYNHANNRVKVLSQQLSTLPSEQQVVVSDSIAYYRQLSMMAVKEMRSFQNKVLQYNRSSLLAAMMNCTREISLPQNLTQEQRWQFVRNHFFDYVNLADARLPHIPTYKQMIDRYVGRELFQHPDSISIGVDTLLNQILRAENKGYEGTVYYYTLNYLFTKFQNTSYTGYDRIFTNMVERHYLTHHLPERTLANKEFMDRVELRYRAVSPSCVGNHAPDLQLRDNQGRWVHTDSLEAEFMVLIFYDIECDHCAKVVNTWKEMLENDSWLAHRTQTVLFYTEEKKNDWLEYIEKNQLGGFVNVMDPFRSSRFVELYNIGSTPSVYVLDKEKTVIGRQIPIERVSQMIRNSATKE